MTEHTYRDTTWRAFLMGSEGWAVFAGPKMLASHLTEYQARLIVTACNCHADLLEALNTIHSTLDMYGHGNSRGQLLNQIYYANSRAQEAIRQVEESAK